MRLFGSQTKQMALLAPPGFDERVRRELTGEAEDIRHEGRRRARLH